MMWNPKRDDYAALRMDHRPTGGGQANGDLLLCQIVAVSPTHVHARNLLYGKDVGRVIRNEISSKKLSVFVTRMAKVDVGFIEDAIAYAETHGYNSAKNHVTWLVKKR